MTEEKTILRLHWYLTALQNLRKSRRKKFSETGFVSFHYEYG